MWDKVTKAVMAAAGAVAGWFGEWNMALTLLAIAMGIDYLSGFIVAWRKRSPKTENGGVSSKAGFDGLMKKAFIVFAVLLATGLDKVIGTGGAVFQTATVFYYIANEGLSIVENAALMGMPFPDVIKNALEQVKSKGTGSDEK